MRKPIFLLLTILVFCSHDLYLKMETYFLQPNQAATLNLYNGTFEKSENVITRDRMLDASVIVNGERTAINSNQWQDLDSTITQFPFKTAGAGTYVAGVSTKARNIELSSEQFNDYLKHDGVLDMLEERTKDSLLDKDAVESYEKHVKAIYQVGEVKTKDWSTAFNYPIEFIPLENPYTKYSGDTLEVQLLLDGNPLSNQLVYADFVKTSHTHHEHSHGDGHSHDHEHSDADHSHDHSDDSHTHTSGQQLRTNQIGTVKVSLPEDGIYYLRTIYMTKVTDNDTLTHASKWATLTFEVTHKHGAHMHTHGHDHDHNHEFPTWIFIVGSLVIIGVFFLIFRKKK